jgi:glycerol kinase
MTYYLGVDQGSHASRAVLFDDNGNSVAAASLPVTTDRYGHGCVEHDAVQLLMSVQQAIQQVLSNLEAAQLMQVAGCGIATQRSTMLAWDAAGAALSPALSWQDVRGDKLLDLLRPHEHEIRRMTGLPLTPYYSAVKMNWMLHNPAAVRQRDDNTLRLSPLISYLLFHLLRGRPYLIDFSNAQRTQLFALDTLTWSERLLELFDVKQACLPQCRPMCTAYGKLAGTGIPVTAVCGDQNAAMFGVGALKRGEALVNIGSGAFVLRELDRFSDSIDQLTGIAYSDNDNVSYMREATVNGAGNALGWAQAEWGIEDLFGSLPKWIDEVSQPPVFINTVGGLGTPWMCSAPDSRFLDKRKYSAAEKAVAVIESIAFMIQVNLELMMAEAPLQRLRVSGGLSHLDGLCQKLSNLSGLEIDRNNIIEATARGVAWLAAGRPDNWSDTVRDADTMRRTFTPLHDEKLEARYRLFRAEMNRIAGASQAGRSGS